jgi:predicted CXXCH cytochrome family protein
MHVSRWKERSGQRTAGLFAACVLAVALLTALIHSQTTDPHNSACLSCHRSQPKPGASEVVRDIDRVCIDCHARSESNSHPVGMVPSMKVPEDMHLDDRGRMTCATCHDIHQQGASGHARYPALLRRSQIGRPFCVACHRTIGTPNARVLHSLVNGTAHAKPPSRTAEAELGPIDSISRECLGCHDGSVATGGETMAGKGGLFDHGGDVGVTHPIGIDYARSAMLNRSLVPPQELNPVIRLVGGMVSCASCHDSNSSSKYQLVMSNTGSALCMQCHRM